MRRAASPPSEPGGAGCVHLVGAGPGDPGLMTVRGAELVARADAVLYDRLIDPRVLESVRPDCETVFVGKAPGSPMRPQEEINAMLVDRARRGQTVVRLKGGDPFVFGRGGEEADALARAGIRFEVVPGVTAAIGAAAYAGIPVTHRGVSRAVAFVTAHVDRDGRRMDPDWASLARFRGTLVFYMSIADLDRLAAALIEAGRDPREPVALVERGTLPDQRTVLTTLSKAQADAAREAIEPPAVVIVGAVADLRPRLAWAERRPLHGLTVVVTRARAQAGPLAFHLKELGAAVIEAPAIRIEADPENAGLRRALDLLPEYELVCFTSRNAVSLFLDALERRGADARAFAVARVAAIGPGTAAALRERGLVADIVPETSTAEGLVEALADERLDGSRVLLPRAANARAVLPDGLRAIGATVDDVAFYRAASQPLDLERIGAVARADYVTFASASASRAFLEAIGETPLRGRIVSIGPATSAGIRSRGARVDIEAERHDLDGLVDAIVADAGRRRAEADSPNERHESARRNGPRP